MSKELPVLIPQWVLERFPPGKRAAVDFLRSLIDPSMLREIAEADYGEDVEQHLAALKPIWSGGELKALDTWYPMEVLELIRWSEPDVKNWKPGSTGVRGHQMRAFSCAVLLATPNFDANKETLIQFLSSALLLGPAATEAAGRFLTWNSSFLEMGEDRPFFALAIAAALVTLEPKMTIPEEELLAEWVEAEEAFVRGYPSGHCSDYATTPWLFGLSFSNMRNAEWMSLIDQIRKRPGGSPLSRLLTEKVPS